MYQDNNSNNGFNNQNMGVNPNIGQNIPVQSPQVAQPQTPVVNQPVQPPMVNQASSVDQPVVNQAPSVNPMAVNQNVAYNQVNSVQQPSVPVNSMPANTNQVYGQPPAANNIPPQNITPAVNNQNNNPNPSPVSDNEQPKKKIPVLVIIAILLLVGVAIYYGYNHFFANNNGGSEPVEEVNEIRSEIVGVWKANFQSEIDDDSYTVYDLTFTLNEDETCTISGQFEIKHTNDDGGSKITVDDSGRYVFNDSGDKLKIEYSDDSEGQYFYREFTDVSIVGGELHLGTNYVYTRVSNGNTASNNSLVGKWYGYADGTKNTEIYYLFNADGTGSYMVNGVPLNFTYEVNGESLFITSGGVNQAKENVFEINGNILSIDPGTGASDFIKE